MSSPANMTDLARLLQAFFCQFLMQQRHASPETVKGYRDTFACYCTWPRNIPESLSASCRCRISMLH
jgi:hypothetical protein